MEEKKRLKLASGIAHKCIIAAFLCVAKVASAQYAVLADRILEVQLILGQYSSELMVIQDVLINTPSSHDREISLEQLGEIDKVTSGSALSLDQMFIALAMYEAGDKAYRAKTRALVESVRKTNIKLLDARITYLLKVQTRIKNQALFSNAERVRESLRKTKKELEELRIQ